MTHNLNLRGSLELLVTRRGVFLRLTLFEAVNGIDRSLDWNFRLGLEGKTGMVNKYLVRDSEYFFYEAQIAADE
jgi:hypothetical protein